MAEAKTFYDKLGLICIKDKRILMVRNKGVKGWYFPGGSREGNETDEQALVREMREELQVEIDGETMKQVGVYEAQADNKPVGTMVRITAYTAEFSGEPVIDNEIAEFMWLGYEDKSETSVIGTIIFDDLRAKKLL